MNFAFRVLTDFRLTLDFIQSNSDLLDTPLGTGLWIAGQLDAGNICKADNRSLVNTETLWTIGYCVGREQLIAYNVVYCKKW